MRWILHIGAPKTGSTAIQRLLCDNREALAQQGVLYPEVSLRGFGHHDLAFLLAGGYPRWATPQPRPLSDLQQDLAAAVAAAPPDVHTLILSSENFYLFPRPAELRDLLLSCGMAPGEDVDVVCYVRRQDEALLSWYNQTVKAQGNAASFSTTARRTRDLWDYEQRLRPWAETFGRSSVIVRDYGPFAEAAGDVRGDFLALLGLGGRELVAQDGRENQRINRDILRLQRLVNLLPLPVQTKRSRHKQLIALTAAAEGVFNDDPFLSGAERAALVQSYARSNAAVARTYLGRDTLFEPVDELCCGDVQSGSRGLTAAKAGLLLKWIFSNGRP